MAKTFEKGDSLHGFTVVDAAPVKEIEATLYRMEHAATGAQLLWISRGDENRTFSIAFRTPPENDTGLPHIMEHSVLCGSDKYPVKEPFVDLLKSSLATFLNALTYSDRTCYPVSSRNERDFLNLMDVYLDAVLHPLSVRSPHAFLQEGWHYELESADAPLTRNGVVYSEMKGAFADPNSVIYLELMRALFPDCAYGCESGGDPAHIPELTYGMYRDFHARFYNPSNAFLFLDGLVDIDAALAKIDSFIAPFGRSAPVPPIPFQKPVAPPERIAPYEIGPDEDPAGKVMLAEGWVCGDYRDRVQRVVLTLALRYFTATNDSPLSRALLERGLCSSVSFDVDALQQTAYIMHIDDVREENVGEVRALARKTLEETVAAGFDRRRLLAMLASMEFDVRECDSGTSPRGIAFMSAAYDAWLYGGDPADAFRTDAVFAEVRRAIDGGACEKLVREAILDNAHHALVRLVPSVTLGRERADADAAALAAVKASWSPEETAKAVAATAAFHAAQKKPDDPADKARLPVLTRADIPAGIDEIPAASETAGGVSVFRPHVDSNGITYATYFFEISDFSTDELHLARLLSEVLTELPTENFDVIGLNSEIMARLGRISFRVQAFQPGGDRTAATPFFVVKSAALSALRDGIPELTTEILGRTRFDDVKALRDLVRQIRRDAENALLRNGTAAAIGRTGASFASVHAVNEHIGGIEALRFFQELDDSGDASFAGLPAKLAALRDRIFARARFSAAVTDDAPASWIGDYAATLPERPAGAPRAVAPFPRRREGFRIAADVSFSARATHADLVGAGRNGAYSVAATALSLDTLWNEVRVQGGAYGTGFSVARRGTMTFRSFRDPQPGRSLGVFARAGDALRAFADSAAEADLDRYVVSTIGRLNPYRSPRSRYDFAVELHMSGVPADDLRRERREILGASAGDFRTLAAALDAFAGSEAVCVVGGGPAFEECAKTLDRVENVQK